MVNTTCIDCGVAIPGGTGRCAMHQSRQRKARSSSAWRAASEQTRSRGVCDNCLTPTLPGDLQADHIRPLGQGGDLLDPMNIWALCRPCHKLKTARELAGTW